ncbi:MAG: YbdK family carboxylate-amine ligase [Actinomycetota bacterium]|nr:YbdK family carboxylate-amine ligase [Actinomycetota bacterium]
MIEQRFGESPPFSVGVEEELMILDAETLEQVPAVDVFLREARGTAAEGGFHTELFASVVELKTGVCRTAREAASRLGELRRGGAAIAGRNGLRLAAAGTHPLTDPEAQPIVEKGRYLDFVRYAGVSARRQGVNGLHVHVGMPSADACLHALEGVLPWLPVVLAASANSPYLAGRETGLASNRAEILAQLPRSCAPPAFRSYREWEGFVERFVRLGLAADYTALWWDVRPHPRFGTLEVRMPDQPTAPALSAAFVALIQALSVTALRGSAPSYDPATRGIYGQNRWAALRFGPDARLVHPSGERAAGVPALLEEMVALVLPAAEELGSTALLAALDPLRCEGGRQLALGRSHGLRAVCLDLVERSVAD